MMNLQDRIRMSHIPLDQHDIRMLAAMDELEAALRAKWEAEAVSLMYGDWLKMRELLAEAATELSCIAGARPDDDPFPWSDQFKDWAQSRARFRADLIKGSLVAIDAADAKRWEE